MMGRVTRRSCFRADRAAGRLLPASWLALLLVGGLGCRYHGGGVARALGPLDGAAADDGGSDDRDGGSDRPRLDAAELSPLPPRGFVGPPETVGCADGSREGFIDPAAWRAIAGCSGAWSVPGVRSPWARAPQCQRAAGNGGKQADGAGCSVADLCAEGWHVCEDGEDVRRHSPTDCESAVPPGFAAFFLTRAAASAYGLCTTDPNFENDLHGCGSFGQPELPGCQPLDRRLSFVDCLLSSSGPDDNLQSPARGWSCGAADQHLSEANLATKAGATLGGVLCCRD